MFVKWRGSDLGNTTHRRVFKEVICFPEPFCPKKYSVPIKEYPYNAVLQSYSDSEMIQNYSTHKKDRFYSFTLVHLFNDSFMGTSSSPREKRKHIKHSQYNRQWHTGNCKSLLGSLTRVIITLLKSIFVIRFSFVSLD